MDLNKTSEDDDLRAEARRRVAARAGFRRHLMTYLLFIAVFWVMWAFGDRSMPPWPVWVTIGWGIAVALQGFNSYGRRDTESEVQREVESLRQGRGH